MWPAIFDVALGLVFVYCFVSLMCSAVREGIEALLKTRAAYLERGIRELLQDKGAVGVARAVYEHPLIAGLYTGELKPVSERGRLPEFFKGQGLPSYIPARTFAVALLDIAARGAQTDAVNSRPAAPQLSVESIRANILNIQSEPVQRVLLAAIDLAKDDIDRARAAVEEWYNNSMDRVSGWYKRSTLIVLFIIGLVLSAAFNIDTVTIVQALYNDEALRDAVVARASSVEQDPAAIQTSFESAKAALTTLELPIGWGNRDTPSVLNLVAGWLLTAMAATLGAPFWFDLLNKLMVIRATVKPREKSPEEASEDRQRKQAAVPAHATAPQPASSPGPTPASVPSVSAHAAEDECGVGDGAFTADEELPAARGGVA